MVRSEGLLEGPLEERLVDRSEGLLEGRSEAPLDQVRLQQAVRSVALTGLRIRQGVRLQVQEKVARVLMDLRFHPLLRMLRRALTRVLPLRPVLLLVLQMFSCRPWSSLTTPYLAA